MPILEVKNIKKGFGDTDVLRGVSFSMERGQVLAIIGSSGSGKTTLLRCLNFLETPDEGEIWLGETRLDTLPADERARLRGRHFGIVYQDFNLLPTLTVEENLRLPLEINHLPRDMARLDALLERLGMSHKRHAWPEQLSGGQRQRVALARALVHQPKWLLADEPTGSLDEHNAEQVMGLMMAAVRDTGAGLLLVSHNPGYGALADRVLRLEGGQLLEARPHG